MPASSPVIDEPQGTSDHPTHQDDYRDRISMRAYELYLARGGADGSDFEDWLAAEREIGAGNGNVSRGDSGE